MDMNPFANNQMQPATPEYLKQDTKNGTVPGAISNMVKAIMDGNNKFQAQQKTAGANAGGAPAVPGPPMSLAPTNPGPSAPPTGAAPMSGTPTELSQSQAISPFEQGAGPMPFAPAPGMLASNGAGSSIPGMPNGIDPTVNALFSPIPGGQFGG